jgi:hypothetical protein
MAGYSGTPLVQKLGIRAGMRVYIGNAPPDYAKLLGRIPTIVQAKRLKGPLDFIQQFSLTREELEGVLPVLMAALAPAGMLWVSWPKKSARVATDLTEDVIRAVALAAGLVDVKVCAVDDTWSGLKLVRRLKDR